MAAVVRTDLAVVSERVEAEKREVDYLIYAPKIT
jgi:hypothetical protein